MSSPNDEFCEEMAIEIWKSGKIHVLLSYGIHFLLRTQ